MVSRRSTVGGSVRSGGGRDRDGIRDRAQLVLVAALTIAFIILGVVVVFNSVLYTQTIASDSSIESTTDARAVETELERSIRGLVHEVNRNGGATHVDSNLTAFSDTYRNATAKSRPALVNVTASRNETGTIVQQREMTNLATEDERLIYETNTATDLRHFVVTIDSNEFDRVAIDFNDTIAGLPETTVEFDTDGDNITVGVQGSGSSCQLEPTTTDDTVTIDLLQGDADARYDEECLDDVAAEIAGAYDVVEFSDGIVDLGGGDDPNTGAFELVIDADSVDDTDFDTQGAALTVDVALTYDSSDLSFERTDEVSVYGDRP